VALAHIGSVVWSLAWVSFFAAGSGVVVNAWAVEGCHDAGGAARAQTAQATGTAVGFCITQAHARLLNVNNANVLPPVFALQLFALVATAEYVCRRPCCRRALDRAEANCHRKKARRPISRLSLVALSFLHNVGSASDAVIRATLVQRAAPKAWIQRIALFVMPLQWVLDECAPYVLPSADEHALGANSSAESLVVYNTVMRAKAALYAAALGVFLCLAQTTDDQSGYAHFACCAYVVLLILCCVATAASRGAATKVVSDFSTACASMTATALSGESTGFAWPAAVTASMLELVASGIPGAAEGIPIEALVCVSIGSAALGLLFAPRIL
jgi:hypothetical protein